MTQARQLPVALAITALVVAFAISLIPVGHAEAAEVRTGSVVRIGPDETIDGDLYMFGTSLMIEGTVNGDVFAAGQQVTVRGTVQGGVTAAGQTVEVTGSVLRGVRAAGQTVLVDTAVGTDLIAAGQSVELGLAGRVGGDAMLGGADIQVHGSIGRRLLGAGQTITVTGTIGQDVDVAVDSLVVEPGAQIRGNVRYRSDNDAHIAAGSVAGQVSQLLPPTDFTQQPVEVARDASRWRAAQVTVLTIVGLLVVGMAPRWTRQVVTQVRQRPGASLVMGLMVLILAVPAFLVTGGMVMAIFALVFGAGGALATSPLPLAGLGLFALAVYISPIVIVHGPLLAAR